MLIENNGNIKSIENVNIKEGFLDLNKHYPFFKLIDLSSLIDYKKYNNNTYQKINLLNSPENHLLSLFLNSERSSFINYSSTNSYRRFVSIQVPNEIKSYNNLKVFQFYNNRISYSTYTLGLNNTFSFVLCIKPEYIYYVKLCFLTDKEIEFDCFYILAKKVVNFNNSTLYKKLYNIISKSIKHYGCEIRYIDSIEAEISENIQLPKFNTIKDYNNWLESVKNNFLESVKQSTKDIEPIELPF